MARSKRTSRRENKRYGHKQARQATRHVLEDGGNPGIIRGTSWSNSIEQAPLNDEAVLKPAPNKKKGCKRNKYGPHVVIPARTYRTWWWNAYECAHCGKTFWHEPKSTKTQAIERGSVITYDSGVREPKPRDDHDDYYNVQMRAIFGDDRCECKACISARDVLN